MLVAHLALLSPAFGATQRVNLATCDNDDNDTIHCSIQDAVDEAAAGDLIQVNAGFYYGGATIDKSLTIEGLGGSAAVGVRPDVNDVTGDIDDFAFQIEAGADVTITGIMVSGDDQAIRYDADTAADAGVPLYSETGGDIDCDTVLDTRGILVFGSATLDDVWVRCFYNGTGPGLYAAGVEVSILNSRFENNQATWSGGHIYSFQTDLVVQDTVFEAGAAALDGGAIAVLQADATIESCHFESNASGDRGGAVFLDLGASVAELWDNSFAFNGVADDGATASADIISETEDLDPTSVFNSATGFGGAAYVAAEEVDVYDNLFCSNTALEDGGGLMLFDTADFLVENNRFVGNLSIYMGGGLLWRTESLAAAGGYDRADIVNNTFIANSGGLVPSPPTMVMFGAGGSIMQDGSLADLRNNMIVSTIAGGAISGVTGDLYEIGDPAAYQYNLFLGNCDGVGCEVPTNLVSELSAQSLDLTNHLEVDPLLRYVFVEGDCVTDAYYPTFASPAVDAGDPYISDVDGSRSDIGAYGGPRATVSDGDGDGVFNIYDCDDTNASASPLLLEICDGTDTDCDGVVDDGFTIVWWTDADADGFGDANDTNPVIGCTIPPGRVGNNTDCADLDPEVNPFNAETCDGIDNDCNGIVDDADRLVFAEYHPDFDGDGFGSAGVFQLACAPPTEDWVLNSTDCNDENPLVNPSAPEQCDDLDNDCDGTIDYLPVFAPTWSIDGDGDGYGNPLSLILSCDQPSQDPLTGLTYVEVPATDCNDADPAIHPTADEVCDGIDQDCNEIVDDDAVDAPEWFVDGDGDEFGDPATATFACEQPDAAHSATKGGDCDDNDEFTQECSGCGCTTDPTPASGGWLVALGLLAARRRRR